MGCNGMFTVSTSDIMKTKTPVGPTFVAGFILCSFGIANAQNLVGAGSAYTNPFGPNTTVTHDVPSNGLLDLTLDNSTTLGSGGIWDLSAQGGANLTVLFTELVNSGAQTRLMNNTLEFNLSNSPGAVLSNLGIGASIHYAWSASGTFDTLGSVLTFLPNTRYSVSFNVEGNNGLLGTVAGVIPQFNFELIDGNGAALDSNGYGTLINVAGLLGTGVPSGTVNLTFDTGAIAPTGALGVRFTGDTLVGANALGIGTNFATVDGLNITAGPVPEPTGTLMLAATSAMFLTRRRRQA